MPRQGEGTSVLPGSKNRANAHKGSPGTWETCSSPPQDRHGSAEPETSRPPAGHPGPRGAKHWRQRVVLPGDDNKAGRMGRSRSALTVPSKQGHRPRRDPVEGRGASSHRTAGGKHAGDIELRFHVHATTADSRLTRPCRVRDGKPQCSELDDLRSRMPYCSWARPDLWEPRTRPSGAIQPR